MLPDHSPDSRLLITSIKIKDRRRSSNMCSNKLVMETKAKAQKKEVFSTLPKRLHLQKE